MSKNCQSCSSNNLVVIGCKHSDMSWIESLNDKLIVYEGYGITGTPWCTDPDYMNMTLCLECGQMQGKFPVLININKESDSESE